MLERDLSLWIELNHRLTIFFDWILYNLHRTLSCLCVSRSSAGVRCRVDWQVDASATVDEGRDAESTHQVANGFYHDSLATKLFYFVFYALPALLCILSSVSVLFSFPLYRPLYIMGVCVLFRIGPLSLITQLFLFDYFQTEKTKTQILSLILIIIMIMMMTNVLFFWIRSDRFFARGKRIILFVHLTRMPCVGRRSRVVCSFVFLSLRWKLCVCVSRAPANRLKPRLFLSYF